MIGILDENGCRVDLNQLQIDACNCIIIECHLNYFVQRALFAKKYVIVSDNKIVPKIIIAHAEMYESCRHKREKQHRIREKI